MSEELERSVEDENDERRAVMLQRMKDSAHAFYQLFGPPGKRTPLGQIALDAIEEFCGSHKALFLVETDRNGATDVPRTFRNLGRREVADLIHHAIAYKESEHVNASTSGS